MASRSSSAVWRFFLKESSDSAQCLLCKQSYSRKGRGTSNLRGHLMAKHTEQHDELLEEEKNDAEKKDSDKTPLQKLKSDIRHRKVDEYFQTIKVWDGSHTKSKEIDKYVAEMLVMDDLPFSHVEVVGFMRLLSKSVPQCRLKQRNFYTTMICTDIYEGVCGQIKKMVCDITETNGNSVSFTKDVWSDTSAGVSLLSLTAHAVNGDFERVNFVLGAQTLEERHTGDNISRTFNDMLSKWGISRASVHCVVRDSGANMRKALFLSGLNNVDCAVHKLQLVIKQGLQFQKPMNTIIEKCRRLATHFHYSTVAQDELKKIQDLFQLPHLKVLHDTPTRWNSTLHMLKRTEEIKEPLTVYIAKNPKLPQFTDIEWLTLSQSVEALEPFEEITKKMSESTSTIADVIPHILCLKNAIQSQKIEDQVTTDGSPQQDLEGEDADEDENQSSVQIVNYIKETMRADIDTKFAGIELDDKYTVATYLDPRYKGKLFSSANITEQVQKSVARLCDELSTVGQSEEETPRKKRKKNDDPMTSTSKSSTNISIKSALARIMASSSDEETEETQSKEKKTMDMIKNYHKEKRIQADCDPLKWWKDNNTKFPELGKLAQQYLSCPPSSVSSEQLFSGAGNIYDEKRSRLHGEKAEKLSFLKKNLPLLDFKY